MTEEQLIEKVGLLARKYYQKEQFSCAEAMVRAFAEVFAPHRYDLESVTRLGTCFNGGFSELQSVCGVFTAGLIVIGMVAGRGNPGDEEAKEEAYTLCQIYRQRFMAAVGSDSCQELLLRWKDQGEEKGQCKRHTEEMTRLLAQTILQVGFHELDVEA
ncbi:MAG: C-GCAxxG-C-C family protein [Magnetococcus sp. DMHC-6]